MLRLSGLYGLNHNPMVSSCEEQVQVELCCLSGLFRLNHNPMVSSCEQQDQVELCYVFLVCTD